ncbi:MAG: carboxypeptidase regulatory-like domain-containing protein, partial [Blastocatellia bacterium]|nr:carboxypeptidase regulatory-like domain-containing protein [Blastocatellia bacterium]
MKSLNRLATLARTLLPVLLLFLAFKSGSAQQQTGEISGRVVTEDGEGVPNVTVRCLPLIIHGSYAINGSNSATTDGKGYFRFTGLTPRLYQLVIYEMKGYAAQPPAANEKQERRCYRIGDNATITLIRGGVITGRVTTADGEPITGVSVGASMVRDADGFKTRGSYNSRSRMTDDRGIYRLYGLAPGTYIVSTTGSGYMVAMKIVPTFYPSSTRDTATEVTVTNGGEATGIDIRLRDELDHTGHTISGTVIGGGEPSTPYILASVTLKNAATGSYVMSTPALPGESDNGFALNGVGDGEYEISVSRGSTSGESLASPPRRLTVKGADITGVELKLAPMASISGRVVLEKMQSACEQKSKNAIQEILLSARKDAQQPADQSFVTDTDVDDKGEFKARNLTPGSYRFETSLPSESWYVKSIAAGIASSSTRRTGTTAGPAVDVLRSGIAVKAGESLTGLTVTVAEGAASLRGRIVAEAEGAALPPFMRVHLIPYEATAAHDLLRHRETLVGGDRSFNFKN